MAEVRLDLKTKIVDEHSIVQQCRVRQRQWRAGQRLQARHRRCVDIVQQPHLFDRRAMYDLDDYGDEL